MAQAIGTAKPSAPGWGSATKGCWTGRVLSGVTVVFLVMDGAMKLVQPQVVIDATRQIGWPADPTTLTTLGLILLACTALYAFPRTGVLGAILLTGYLGGAVAAHARLGDPLLTHVLFGLYLGLFVWGGLWLRDPRIRSLLPFTYGRPALPRRTPYPRQAN